MGVKTYKYKLKPTKEQAQKLQTWLDICRYVYNTALDVKNTAYKTKGVNISFVDLSRQFTEAKSNVYSPESAQLSEYLSQVPRTFITMTLKRLDLAYQAFYRRCKKGETPGFPKFKGKDYFDTLEFQGLRFEANTWIIPKLGGLKYFKDRLPTGQICDIAKITKEPKGWFLCVSFEYEPQITAPKTLDIVGVDLGVVKFVALSNGVFYDNPKYGKQYADKIAQAQRDLQRKKKGSNRRRKAKKHLAMLQGKLKNVRNDYHHKVSAQLIANYSGVVVEKLKVKNMTKSAKGTVESPGAKVKQKAGLNRSILDMAPGAFIEKLRYKAKAQSRYFEQVNPAYTSQTCPQCGHIDKQNRLTQADFCCISCGYKGNADTVAAINILNRRGTAVGR